jgi:putative endonuclease
MKEYFVYIMTNRSGTLYTGITSDLKKRVWEHANKMIKGFTSKYNIDKLIYFEVFQDPNEAIKREKTLKGWKRNKKIELVKTKNPEFNKLELF